MTLKFYQRKITKLKKKNIKAEERRNRRIRKLEEVILTLQKQDVGNEETSFKNERKSQADLGLH